MENNLDSFYLSQSEPNKSCFLALRQIILEQNSAVSETRKYGMPCFTYKNKAFCYLWKDKKTENPYILFVEGNQLDFPELETGDRKRMKIYNINPNEDLPLETINFLLQEALKLY